MHPEHERAGLFFFAVVVVAFFLPLVWMLHSALLQRRSPTQNVVMREASGVREAQSFPNMVRGHRMVSAHE